MSRTISNTVEYFPHFAKQGKTLYILKSRYGNNGYAFWFQLLEVLSQSENHFYDCHAPDLWQYLLSICGSNEITGTEILNLLATLGNIDAELWQKKVIWCPKLVENLADVYKKRGREQPSKPIIDNNNLILDTNKSITATEMPQSKVKKSKVKKSIKSNSPPKKPYGEFQNVFLTDDEVSKLKEKFNSTFQERIDYFSGQLASKGYRFQSHYATILTWDRNDKKRGESNGINNKISPRQLPTKYHTPEEVRGIKSNGLLTPTNP